MARLIGVLLVAGLSSAMSLPVAAQSSAARGVDYKLDDGSTFQRGCFAPCACPVGQNFPIRGTLRLVPQGFDPLYTYYAVTNVSWQVLEPNGIVIPIAGSGTFKIGGEVAITEELSLDLSVGGDPAQHFDSGLVVASAPFPLIDLVISIHGMVCLDTVIHVRARPFPRVDVTRSAIDWDPDPPAPTYDAVRGNLSVLRATGGDFGAATTECVASDLSAESVTWTSSPPPGGADWFLVRTHDGGSYDAWDRTLVAPRDPGIDAAAGSCP